MQGQTVQLEVGDVAFVPMGTRLSYWSRLLTLRQVFIFGSGRQTLGQQLLQQSGAWD